MAIHPIGAHAIASSPKAEGKTEIRRLIRELLYGSDTDDEGDEGALGATTARQEQHAIPDIAIKQKTVGDAIKVDIKYEIVDVFQVTKPGKLQARPARKEDIKLRDEHVDQALPWLSSQSQTSFEGKRRYNKRKKLIRIWMKNLSRGLIGFGGAYGGGFGGGQLGVALRANQPALRHPANDLYTHTTRPRLPSQPPNIPNLHRRAQMQARQRQGYTDEKLFRLEMVMMMMIKFNVRP